MEDMKTREHESYGMIQIDRVTGGKESLFGSSILHDRQIRLSIHPADITRGLNKDWFHADEKSYIEIYMSHTQFVDAMTNMNTEGTPCTIKKLNQRRIEDCPFTNKRQEFDNEFKESMDKLTNKLSDLTDRAEEILKSKKPTKKSEKEEILNRIHMLKQEIKSNIPFIKTQFTKQMYKTVVEAKSEIESFWSYKTHQLGLEGLEKEKVKMLGEVNEINKK